MKVVRSWPDPGTQPYPVENTPHVEGNDLLPHMLMSRFDYRQALVELDEDVIILEWDTAVGLEDVLLFQEYVKADSGRVHVAPYKLYYPKRGLEGAHWVHRIVTGPVSPNSFMGDYDQRWVTPEDSFCHFFGFGMTYIPKRLVRMYHQESWDGRMTDGTFSHWHYKHPDINSEVPIHWDVKVVHLHFDFYCLDQ